MKIITWDWKEQPDWDEVNAALRECVTKPAITPVDTQSDQYAIVVHDVLNTKEQAQRFYDEHCFDL